MIKNYKLLLCFCTAIFIVGCTKNENIPLIPDNINIEMVGTWGNDGGCVASYTMSNEKLILVKFSDTHSHTFHNVMLSSKKESIMTKFKSLNPKVKFSGNFLEGVIIIDNYCTEPLHKIDN